MIFPLSSDAVPFLGSSDDDIGRLHIPKVRGVRVACELDTVQPNPAELCLPVSLTLRTKSLRWRLIDNLVLARSICGYSTTYCQFQHRGLAAACGRREDKIVA